MKFALKYYLIGFIYFVMPLCAVAQDYIQAAEALLEGDTSYAYNAIQQPDCKKSPQCVELSILYHLMSDKVDVAIDELNTYEVAYSNEARTHAFAAETWRLIGHQVNIFRKRTYYKKALQAKFQAGVKLSALPQHKVMLASAHGQQGEIDNQKTLTADIIETAPKWGAIAQINLAQNMDDFVYGEKIVAQALNKYPEDFFINERVAQFYWTIDKPIEAQQHFLKACKTKPQAYWYDRKKWLEACTLVVQFTEQENINPQAAVDALVRILSEHTLLTLTNVEYAVLLLQTSENLAEQAAKDIALAFLESVIHFSKNKNLVRIASDAKNKI